MMPVVINRNVALSRIMTGLRVPTTVAMEAVVTLPLIAQALRRAAQILAPCLRHELERAVSKSFSAFEVDNEDLSVGVSEALDLLLAFGDVFEMRSMSEDPWSTGPLIIRPAPPTFVLRGDGSAIVLGVAGDELTLLSDGAYSRLSWHGVLRILSPEAGESPGDLLVELGAMELSERNWLKLPQVESALSHVATWRQRLPSTGQSISEVQGLEVIDGRMSPDYYKGRWTTQLEGLKGLCVARRMQRYGSPLWCLADIVDASQLRLLDLSALPMLERPCDLAWRLQMACDAVAGKPQRASMQQVGDRAIVTFFSPLPTWAERKLTVCGEKVKAERGLFAYSMPVAMLDDTTNFLQNYLWLTVEPVNSADVESAR